MKDRIGADDAVTAGISTEVVAPEHACPKCSKAMKDANTEATRKAGQDIRICSNRACRAKADWTSGKPEILELARGM